MLAFCLVVVVVRNLKVFLSILEAIVRKEGVMALLDSMPRELAISFNAALN